jgi:hypothetical protein
MGPYHRAVLDYDIIFDVRKPGCLGPRWDDHAVCRDKPAPKSIQQVP